MIDKQCVGGGGKHCWEVHRKGCVGPVTLIDSCPCVQSIYPWQLGQIMVFLIYLCFGRKVVYSPVYTGILIRIEINPDSNLPIECELANPDSNPG